ncbi:unnamed protein product, partial [Darwinula stevensoni]
MRLVLMSEESLPESRSQDLNEMDGGEIHLRDEDPHPSHDRVPMEGSGRRRQHENDEEHDDDDDDWVPIIGYTIQEVGSRFIKRFNAHQRELRARFEESEFSGSPLSSIMASLNISIDEMLRKVTEGAKPRDFIRAIIKSDGMDHAISTKVTRVEDMSPELILTTVTEHLQSNKELELNGSFTLDFLLVSYCQGGTGLRIINPEIDKKVKRSIIQIKNEDDLCIARAIVVALAKINVDPKWKSICDSRRPMQGEHARKLHEEAGVPFGKCGVEEARQFEDHLGIQINIVSLED